MNRERRTLRNNQRILRDFRERNFDCFFELRITSGYHIRGSDLDVEVRSDAHIFYAPGCSTRIVRGAIRKPDLPAVNERWSKVVRTDAAAESSLADDWTNLRKLEHKRAGL